MPRIRRKDIPPALFAHLLDRIQERRIEARQLALLAEWLDQWKAKGWKRGRNEAVANEDLWRRLDGLRTVHELHCHWIRGHNEHPENERCDRLAVAAAERFRGDGA